MLVGGLVFGIKEYIYYGAHEVTDDAQIDADISPVVARVTGYVKEIRFVDNQFVHAGDTLVVLDDRDYQLKLQQTLAALTSTKQSVDVSQQQVSEAQTSIATAQAAMSRRRKSRSGRPTKTLPGTRTFITTMRSPRRNTTMPRPQKNRPKPR